MGQTHKALIQNKSGQLSVSNAKTLTPMDDQLLVSIISLGICGTDLQILRKTRADAANILGHEGIGIIADVGKNITEFTRNQLVVFNPVNPNRQEEILGHSFDGIFQEKYIVTKEQIGWGLIQPLTYQLSPEVAPLIEPLGTVLYGHSLVDQVCHQETIIVVGAGAIGLSHVLYAKSRGIKNVFLVNRSQEKLDWVTQHKILKPEECFLDTENLVNEILEKTNGRGVNAVYLCTPRESAKKVLNETLLYVKENGCIDLVGGFKDGDEIQEFPSVDLNSIRRSNICGRPSPGVVRNMVLKNGKKIFLTGHRGTSKEMLNKAISVLYNNPAYFKQLVTHVFDLNEATSFLDKYIGGSLSEEKKSSYIKGIIVLAKRKYEKTQVN